MAFIINKISKKWGKERKLYYLVRNYRKDGKINREHILNLGESPNLSERLLIIQNQKKTLMDTILETEKRLERIKKGDLSAFNPFTPPYKQVFRTSERIKEMKTELFCLQEEEKKLLNLIKFYPNCSDKEP